MRMAAYCRVSTDEEKQLDSLGHQMAFFEEFAKREGYTLAEVYADSGITGRQLKRREAFQRMLREAEEGKFEFLAVKDVSRFARNTVDLLTAVRYLKALGVEVLFLSHSQRVLGESEFVLTLFGAMAQEESANLSKRVKFGKEVTARQGRVPTRVFGYDWVDNFHLQINPEEAETVREIFRLYTEEKLGGRRIAEQLRLSGRRSKSGRDWDAKGVGRVLRNPLYCGRLENHKYEVTDFLEGTVAELPPEARYSHARPEWALVSEETFRRAEAILRVRQREGRGTAAVRSPFGGLLRCALCAGAYTRRSYTYQNTRIYWVCGTRNQHGDSACVNRCGVEETELRWALADYLTAVLGDPAAAAAELCLRLESGRAEERGERERILRRMERYRWLYADGHMSMESLREKLGVAEARLAALDHRQDWVTAAEAGAEIQHFFTLVDVTLGELRAIFSAVEVGGDGAVTVYIGGDRPPMGAGSEERE